MKKNVVIIAYAYPPNNVAGAQRPYALAKYLDKCMYNVTVITCENPDLPLGKNEDFDAALEGVEQIFLKSKIGNSAQAFRTGAKSGKSLLAKVKVALFKIAQKFVFPDKGMFWFPNVKNYLKSHPDLIESTDYIFSTSPGITNHQIARYIKRRNKSAKWIADFRDFNYVNHWDKAQGIRSIMHRKLERSLLADATHITYVTQTMLAMNQGYYPQFAKKMHVVYNGFEAPVEGSDSELVNTDTNKLTFFYAGTFYNGVRSPFPLLALLDRVYDEGLLHPSNVVIEIAGNIDDETTEKMKDYSSFQNITFLGNLSRTLVLAKMQQASFLWLIVGNIPSHYQTVPIKLFEYIAARRPIVNFAPDISESSKIIDNMSLGTNFNTLSFDIDSSFSSFREIACRFKSGDYAKALPKENLESFSWTQQVRLIENLMR